MSRKATSWVGISRREQGVERALGSRRGVAERGQAEEEAALLLRRAAASAHAAIAVVERARRPRGRRARPRASARFGSRARAVREVGVERAARLGEHRRRLGDAADQPQQRGAPQARRRRARRAPASSRAPRARGRSGATIQARSGSPARGCSGSTTCSSSKASGPLQAVEHVVVGLVAERVGQVEEALDAGAIGAHQRPLVADQRQRSTAAERVERIEQRARSRAASCRTR